MAVTKLSNSGIKTGVLKYDSMLAGNAAFIPGDFYSIASTTLSSTQTVISFTNIPQTYDHLQLRIVTRYSGGDAYYGYTYNNDQTEGNYNWCYGFYNSAGTMNTQMAGWIPQNAHTDTNLFGATIIEIIDYTNTTQYKTSRVYNGYAGSPFHQLQTSNNGWYGSTNAITRIDVKANMQGSSSSFYANSVFSLYGIKGA